MTDKRPEICMKDVLEQKIKDGKPLILNVPQTVSKETECALKKCLQELNVESNKRD